MKIKFIKPKKKKVSKKLAKFLRDKGYSHILNTLKKSKNSKNYFDFSTTDKSRIGYLNPTRTPNESHLLFDKEYRRSQGYQTSIGKLLAGEDVKQIDIQKLSAEFVKLNHNKDFSLKVTSEIVKSYRSSNYSVIHQSGGGSLYCSCMRNMDEAVEFYERLGSDIVQLVVLLDKEGRVAGRALLWKTVVHLDSHIPVNTYFLDRAYTANDNLYTYFEDFANQNGYAYRTYNGERYYKNERFHSEMIIPNIYIDLDWSLPYVDTFRYYTEGELSSYSGDYYLDSTDGNQLDGDAKYCGCCDNQFDLEDEGGWSDYESCYLCGECGEYVDYLGDYRYSTDCVYSEISNCVLLSDDAVYINGEYYSDDHERIVQIDRKYYLKDSDEVCYSEYDSEYYLIDDCVYSENLGSYILVNDSIEVDEEYYHEDETEDLVQIDGTYYLKDSDEVIFNEEISEYELVN